MELDSLSLPMGANPDRDPIVSQWDDGTVIRRSPFGVEYSIRPTARQPEFETEAGTLARATEVASRYATDAVQGLIAGVSAPARAARGEAMTTGDVLGTAGMATSGSFVRRPSGTPQGTTTQPVSEVLPDTPDVETPPVLSTLPEERPRAVIREDNTYRGAGTVRTSMSANDPSPFATRTTAQSQIDDMIFSGVVRPPEGGYRGEAIMYFGGYDNELPTSMLNRPNPSKPYTIVARGETVAGKEGPIPIDELLHVWTIKDGEYVDILPEILQRNKDYSEASGDTTPNFSEGGEVTKNMETQMSTLLQEGGIADDGMTTDPVSGNEIPPGSMAEEVRDDVDAKLSQGEYVVPADVVRFFGVAFFEDLRSKAKEGLAEMESNGRIGGETEEDLPEMQMAKGGDVGIDKDARRILESLKRSPQLRERLQRSGVTIKMAEGGDVGTQTQAAFAPPPFSQIPGFSTFAPLPSATPQNIEYRTYENAGGQKITIMFVDGVAKQEIPQGYFPEGQVPPEVEKPKAERQDRDPNLIATTPGTQAAPRTPEVNLYGMSENDLSEWAQGGFGGTMSGFGGLIGTAADLDSLSRTRAAAMVARDRGLTALETQLNNEAATMERRLGPLGDLLKGAVASGITRYEAQQQFKTGQAPVGTTPGSTASTRKGTSQARSTPITRTPTGQSKGSTFTPKSATPTRKGSSQARTQPVSRSATGQSKENSFSSGTGTKKPENYSARGGGSKSTTPSSKPLLQAQGGLIQRPNK